MSKEERVMVQGEGEGEGYCVRLKVRVRGSGSGSRGGLATGLELGQAGFQADRRMA